MHPSNILLSSVPATWLTFSPCPLSCWRSPFFSFILPLAFWLGASVAQSAPGVSNLTAAQRTGTTLVDIRYDLSAPGVSTVAIALQASSDGGATWAVPVVSVRGAIGSNVAPGTGKTLVWNAGTDWPQGYSIQMRFRVTAEDGVLASLGGFSYIPAGRFTMGYTSGDKDPFTWFTPSVSVTVSAFYLQQMETTKAQWDEVRTWGLGNGYTDLAAGAGKGITHPVQAVSWWDVVKWCNARSEKEGLTPVYTVSGAVMKTGTTAPVVNWTANGYRLPTEAEWEKAARGGVSGKRFPWGTDTISHSQANYFGRRKGFYWDYGIDESSDYHPSYSLGEFPYTSPVGSFSPNGYGMYDMAGNVSEWCWDWYGDYVDGASDPRGGATAVGRAVRGGNYSTEGYACRAGVRLSFERPGETSSGIGFRPARSSVP
jgi:formylglycine-generating enzyme required for sulfatase activity